MDDTASIIFFMTGDENEHTGIIYKYVPLHEGSASQQIP